MSLGGECHELELSESSLFGASRGSKAFPLAPLGGLLEGFSYRPSERGNGYDYQRGKI